MKDRWAAGIQPRNFAWILRDQLAVSERPGGCARTHRRVRRHEELIWIKKAGFGRIISLLPSPHNLHAYTEAGLAFGHHPLPPEGTPGPRLEMLFGVIKTCLGRAEMVLVHHEEVGDTLLGVVAGYLLWSGRLKERAQAITAAETLLSKSMGPWGVTLVSESARLAATHRPIGDGSND